MAGRNSRFRGRSPPVRLPARSHGGRSCLLQVLLLGPPLAVVWVAGLISLLRSQQLMLVRFFAWAWLTLAVVFMASGGKPYYLAGLLPVLTAAGALVTDGWLARGRARENSRADVRAGGERSRRRSHRPASAACR